MILRVVCILALVALATCVNRGSLTFVIDDTLSMGPTIREVKTASLKIMDIVFSKPTTPIEDIVLVTFNDPTFELRVKTRDKQELEKALNAIHVHNVNNRWCPEYSLSGLELGLLNGLNNSFVFLFTDAAACDEHKWKSVINTAQELQTQVNFIITPSHCNTQITDNYVYHKIAAQTNGQIFHLKSTTEIQDLFKYVDTVIAGERTVIVAQVIPAYTHVDIPFTVDEQTEYVVVSASGKDVKLDVTGPIKHYEHLTWVKNTKMMKLNYPEPGNYTAKVFGSSSTSVMVFGRTDFTFEHGFSTVPASSLSSSDKQPIDDSTYYLLISVTDPLHSVKINNVILRSMDGRDLKMLPLKKVTVDFYTTDQFKIPSRTDLLDIVVTGVGIKTHRPIRRKSKTPVVVRKQDIKPRITLDKTTVSIDYNSEVVIVCNVKAHPKPTIKWFTESHTPMITKEWANPPYDYGSRVTLSNVKKSQRVRCTVENKFGTTSQDSNVIVKSPFIVHDEPLDQTKHIHYGKSGTIHCNIKSNFNMQINWFRATRSNKLELIENSPKFSISKDETELTIKNMGENTEGKYVCEAFIIGDDSTKHVLSRKVHIQKAAPAINVDKDLIVVPENIPELRIKCNILDGYPRPTVSWLFRSGSKDFRHIPGESSTELILKNIDLEKAGNYTCIVKNEIKSVSRSINVVVEVKPVIEKGNDVTVKENASASLGCRIMKSYPKALMSWEFKKAGSETFIKRPEIGEHITIQKASLHDAGNYKCIADNGIGKAEQVIELFVEVKPVIEKGNDVTVKEHASATLSCRIMKSYPKASMSWEFKKAGSEIFIKLPEIGEHITIQKASLHDAGNYKCIADNGIGKAEQVIELLVEVKPVVEKGNDVTVKEKASATLSCRIMKSYPKSLMSWEFKKAGSETFIKRPEIGEHITIQKASLHDAGNYKCIADNGIGKAEQVIELFVEAPPKIHKDKPVQTAVEGDAALKMLCNVTGYPKPSIVWTRGGNTIKPDGEKYIIVDGNLIIKNPLKSDNDYYTCVATNKFGTDRITVETYITPIIEFDEDRGDEKYIYILKGDSKQLECGNNTQERIFWYKENIPVNESRTFTIKDATFYDDGNYTCRVSTLDNVTAQTYVVDVGYPPVFLDKVSTKINWDGDYQQLRCEVRMKPEVRTVKVKWTYNGEALKTMSQVQDIIGWGNYTCKISNKHGEVQKSFSVYSSDCLLRRDSPNENMPVIFDKDSMWPEFDAVRNYFILQTNYEMKLSCNSQAERQNNFKNFPGQHEIVAFCDREDKFTVGDKTYKFDDLVCEYPVLPTFQSTGDKCLQKNTELIKVGFGNDNFVEAYEVCYDRINENALYTRTDMSTPINLPALTDRTWKKYTLAADDGYYNCTGDATCCFARAQLLNAQDVKYGPPQAATDYIRLNSVPLWRACGPDQLTWDAVEKTVREILLELNTIRVWTGASEYTARVGEKSPNIQDKPRYLWKVLKSEELALVIVYINDAFATSSDVRCKGTCPADVPSSTYTYCCELHEFSKAFGIPESVFNQN